MSLAEKKFEEIDQLLKEGKNVYITNRRAIRIRKEKSKIKEIYVVTLENGEEKVFYPSEMLKISVKVY